MAYQLTLFDWSLFTLPDAIPMTDIEGDSHANDPNSPDYTNTAPTWIGQDFTFAGGTPTEIIVNDDDLTFEDGYVETGGLQTLAQDVTINGTTYLAGTALQNEFSLVDANGHEIWVLSIGGTNVGFVYPAAHDPAVGETFTPTTGRDGDATDSGDGVSSSESYRTMDTRDGVVEGTAAHDNIDAAYTGDPGGDQIDDGFGYGPDGNANVVVAGEGNDTVAAGLGDDTVYGQAGNDFLDGQAGQDTLYGGAGADAVLGGEGNDVIEGGGGNDSLAGQAGHDTVSGGDGDDYLFLGAGNDVLEGGSGSDQFVASDGFGHDTVTGGELGNDADYLDFSDLTTGVTLTFSATEAGTATASGNTVAFSEIENFWLSDQADSVDGTASTGYMGIGAGAGNDTVFTGAGDDIVLGGAGHDSIDAGSGADAVDGGAGSDTIRGGTGDDDLSGGLGSDSLEGGDGNDTLAGGDDNDVLQGQAGNDTLSGDNGADELSGGAGDDSLSGGTGNDTLTGGLGHDTLQGGAGNDSLIGGDGNDAVYTGTGADTVETGSGSDTVYLDSSDGGGANVLTDSGPVAADVDVPDNDTIILGTGAGTYRLQGNFSGASGFEVIDGSGAIGDTLGTQDSIATFDFTDVNLAGVDEISGTGNNDSIIGSAGDDFITGDAGNDSLTGGAGADTLHGEVGNDTLLGQAGNDDLAGGSGFDRLEGGDGNDRLQGESGNDTLYGDAGTDTLDGGTGDDHLFGGDGADLLQGGSGGDTLYGGQGGDSLRGGDGNDVLSGDDFTALGGNDTIFGDTGDDTLNGNAGADLLTGGAGNDLFLVSEGHDTVTDFNSGNTGALGDGNIFNNDYLNLADYYDSLDELRADQADDNVLNHSNTHDTEGRAVDYSDNAQFGTSRSMTVQGASADSYTYDNTGIVCFTAGTRIQTPRGAVPVETLTPGDLVDTLDHGPQPLLWVGTRHVASRELVRNESLRPVLIRKGVLGNTRDLLVSRQHGVMVGADHLVRAVHLAREMRGVRVANGKREVTYVHLFFARHQIVFAEGIASESFYPGPQAMKMLAPAARRAFLKHVPALGAAAALERAEIVEAAYGATARPFVPVGSLEAELGPKRGWAGLRQDDGTGQAGAARMRA